MKTSLFTSLFILILSFFVQKLNGQEKQTISLDDFDAVKTSLSIEVEIIKANESKAIINSNYPQELDVVVKNNVLFVEYKPNVSLQNAKTKVTVYTKSLKSVEAESSAIVNVKSLFDNAEQLFDSKSGAKINANSRAQKVTVTASMASVFSGKLETDLLIVTSEAASKVILSGKAEKAIINSNSAGEIDALQTNIKTAEALAAANSSIKVSVSKELVASATSLSKIRYRTLSGIKFSAERSSGGTIDSI